MCSTLGKRPQLIKRVAQQSRYLHLRDPDAGGYLRLGQVLEEAEPEDPALARRDVHQHTGERCVELDELIALVLLPHRIAVSRELLSRAAARRVQRNGPVRLDDLPR